MANITDKTVTSKYQPKQTNVIWIDVSEGTPIEKHFINGQWVAVSSNGSGSSFRTEIVDTTVYATLGDFLKSAIGENGVIYLYPNSNPYGENTYTELLWVEDDSKFEIIDRDITIDSTPISASPNPVSSGGVYTALQGKADKIPVAYSIPQGGMLPNVLYLLGTISTNTTFTLAAATDNTIANVWMWTFKTGKNPPTINWPQGITAWNGGETPIIAENYHYEISVMYGVASFIAAPLPVGGGE